MEKTLYRRILKLIADFILLALAIFISMSKVPNSDRLWIVTLLVFYTLFMMAADFLDKN